MELEEAADGDVVRGHLPGFGKIFPIGRPKFGGLGAELDGVGPLSRLISCKVLYLVPLWGSSILALGSSKLGDQVELEHERDPSPVDPARKAGGEGKEQLEGVERSGRRKLRATCAAPPPTR